MASGALGRRELAHVAMLWRSGHIRTVARVMRVRIP